MMFWNVQNKNIVQVGENILHHLYQNLKVCKIEGSTLWMVNYNVSLYFLV